MKSIFEFTDKDGYNCLMQTFQPMWRYYNETDDYPTISTGMFSEIETTVLFLIEEGEKSGWTVENGVFTFNASDATGEGNKSLLTDEVFESFEIEFEWMVSPGSNSGFMWGVSEDKMYEHPHVTGPEIQVIDADIYGDDPDHQKHTVGALYDMIPPSTKPSKKAGEWNKYHITVDHNKNKGTVFLNGIIVNSFPLTGPEWDSMVENSKFRDMSGFGKYKKGHITLQDHPGIISYKNIKIKRL